MLHNELYLCIPTNMLKNLCVGRAQEFELNRSSLNEGTRNKGMILPFQPLTMTFHKVNYFVDMPKVCLTDGFRLP